MLKYILAAATALTVATSAQSATIMIGGFMNGKAIYKSEETKVPGVTCQMAVALTVTLMEADLGNMNVSYWKVDAAGVKHYKGRTNTGIDVIYLCQEDGVSL
jgi:hypothetical protein